MRTTINIPDKILREARIRAAERSESLTEYITESLQRNLLSESKTQKPVVYRISTFRGKGLRPGIDLDDSSSVMDAMEPGA